MSELKKEIAGIVKRNLIEAARRRAAEKRNSPDDLKAKLEEKFKDKLKCMAEWDAELKRRCDEFRKEFDKFNLVVAKAAHGTGFEARVAGSGLGGINTYEVKVYPGCQSVGADVKRELKTLAKELGVEELLKNAE